MRQRELTNVPKVAKITELNQGFMFYFVLNLLCCHWSGLYWKIQTKQKDKQTSKGQPFLNPAVLVCYRHMLLSGYVKVSFWKSPSHLSFTLSFSPVYIMRTPVYNEEEWTWPSQHCFLLASLLSQLIHGQKANPPAGFCFNSGRVVRFESASSRANSSLILYSIRLCNCVC